MDARPSHSHHKIASDRDIVSARQHGRTLAAEMGFSRPDQALIATAISELARNIMNYAGLGEIRLERVEQRGKSGLQITALDEGPGIANIEEAMTDGFSTGASLGLGLPGTRRIVDDFEITSTLGHGVTVIAIKWLR